MSGQSVRSRSHVTLPPARGSIQNRLGYIEALRGLAALYVVLFHLARIPQPNLAVPNWTGQFILTGSSGVTLFFMVSAFTLSLSMRLREQEPQLIQHFYVRRIFRIVPLFYVWIVISLLRERIVLGVTRSAWEVLLSLFFGFNLVPGLHRGFVWASWTLGVEMIFYLLFPLIYRHINDCWKALGFFFLTLLVSGFYGNLLTYLPIPASERESFFQMSFLRHLPVFVLGMFIFFVFERFIQGKSRPYGWALALVAVAIYGYNALLLERLRFLFDSVYWQAVFYGGLLLGLAIAPLGLFVNRVTRFYGEISYSLYLNHSLLIIALIPVYRTIATLHLPITLQYGACLLLTLGLLTPLSYCTYRFIEQPGIRWGSALIKNMRARRPTDAGLERHYE